MNSFDDFLQQLPADSNIKAQFSSGDTTVTRLIASHAKHQPNKLAVIDGTAEITYAELMQRASDVAGELAHRGIEPGALVAVCMNRSWQLVATLIGIMQAGCAYVPLDPTYPAQRVQFMLEHSQAAAAIIDSESTASLCQSAQVLIDINNVSAKQAFPDLSIATELAYIIYTSGSTGQPKGVAVEHRNILAMTKALQQVLSQEELSGFVAAASVCFDTSVLEIFGTLTLAGTMILANNILQLPELPAIDRVKACVMVPSSMHALLTAGNFPTNIQCVLFGGEALKRSLVDQVHALSSKQRIVNCYGPTEDTVFSTFSQVETGSSIVTIGNSVPGSRAYILDDQMQPVASGEAGELYLAGTKLARGYLFDEARTQERFISLQPSALIPDNRLYKTGDLCRWTDDGQIEFLGRVDQQVKIRGYRIELEEIESSAESIEGITAAAALAVDNSSGQQLLTLYVVTSDPSLDDKQIKTQLSQKLPKYMLPQLIRHIDALPLLPNDKLDRNKLTEMANQAT